MRKQTRIILDSGGVTVRRTDQRTFHTTHDGGRNPELSTHIVLAVDLIAAELGRETGLTAGERLVDRVDPEALDGLFRSLKYRTDRDEGWIEFPFRGFHIRVDATGEIVIVPVEDED